MNYLKFPYSETLTIKDRPFTVYWSKAAARALDQSNTGLLVEMELKFACMVRMRVLFHETIQHPNAVRISDKLSVIYRPVMGQSCSLEEAGTMAHKGEIKSGPMADRHPKQLGIDYVRGSWLGEYS